MTEAITRRRLLRLKGRSGGDSRPFAYLPVELLTSPAVRTLPHVAHRVLVSLAAQFGGARNGSLTFTRRTARSHGICDPHALYAGLAELEQRGLIIRTRPGSRIPPRASLYALGWWPIHEPLAHDQHDEPPTFSAPDAWRAWRATRDTPHWTISRRAARWRVPTSAGGASPSVMGGASPSRPRAVRVARPANSNYSGGRGVA
jgi:hypothetical protein